jgi:hypothetical protein
MQLPVIQNKIHEIRDQKVILDFDLAELYQTETKYLKRMVKANLKRFPPDFMFELSNDEWKILRCNFSTSNTQGIRYLPFAFTEQGVAMLSGILNSEIAIDVNITIMRTFVLIRQYALTNKELTIKLQELEVKYNKQFKDICDAINFLLQKDKLNSDQNQRKRIGYKP